MFYCVVQSARNLWKLKIQKLSFVQRHLWLVVLHSLQFHLKVVTDVKCPLALKLTVTCCPL